MTRRNVLASLAASSLFVVAMPANAAVIFQWGGGANYVAANVTESLTVTGTSVDFDNDGATDDTARGRAFSLSSSIVTSGSYTGPAIYGASANGVLNGTGTNSTTFRITDDATNGDLVGLPYQLGSTARVYAHHIAFLKSQMPLVGVQSLGFAGSGANWVIDELFLATGTIDSSAESSRLRWWVQSGGNFYLSNTVDGGGANQLLDDDTTYDDGVLDLASMTWTQAANISTGTFTSLLFTDSSGTVTSSAISNITAIGFAVLEPVGKNGSGTQYANIRTFRVSAYDAIPEPASLGVLGLGSAVMLTRRRR